MTTRAGELFLGLENDSDRDKRRSVARGLGRGRRGQLGRQCGGRRSLARDPQLPSNFVNITPPNIIPITLVGVAAAVIVFAVVARVAPDPLRTYTFVVAPLGLIVSWLFDVALYVTRAFPGTTGRGAVALMFLHVTTGVITVLLLRAQGLPKAPASP
jgi:hypothetical protein